MPGQARLEQARGHRRPRTRGLRNRDRWLRNRSEQHAIAIEPSGTLQLRGRPRAIALSSSSMWSEQSRQLRAAAAELQRSQYPCLALARRGRHPQPKSSSSRRCRCPSHTSILRRGAATMFSGSIEPGQSPPAQLPERPHVSQLARSSSSQSGSIAPQPQSQFMVSASRSTSTSNRWVE